MTTDSRDDHESGQPAALGCNEGLGLVGDSTVLDCWRANYGLDKTPHELHSFWQHCTPPGAVLALKAAVSEIERLREELRRAGERAEFLLAATRDAQDHALAYGVKVNTYAEALRRVKCEAISLADAQVLALEALGPNVRVEPGRSASARTRG